MVRVKTRLVVVEFANTRGLSKALNHREDVANVLKDALALNFGDFGVGKSQITFQVIYYNRMTRLAVFRCARELTLALETCCAMLTTHSQSSTDLRVRVVRVCGCSRTCRKHLVSLTNERLADCLNPKLQQLDRTKLLNEISKLE